MTKQEIFNKVYEHLLTQKEISTRNEIYCAYRGNDGKKCAVGCLILDEEYKPEMECKTIDQLFGENLLPKNHPLENHIMFLDELQSIHDQVDCSEWEYVLGELAKEHNLYLPKTNIDNVIERIWEKLKVELDEMSIEELEERFFEKDDINSENLNNKTENE